MALRELPTVIECLDRLQSLDDAMGEAQDRRTYRRLEVNRNWWADQLLEAQAREGFPQWEERKNDTA